MKKSIFQKHLQNHLAAPLVSCIMPTSNRRMFVPNAIKYFLNQDYPNKELIIIDDGTDKVEDLIPDDERILYIGLEKKTSLGYLRNLAVKHSKGQIIAHWDDDDWYAENRISYQVQPLLDGRSEISGINTSFFYDLLENTFWSCEPDIHARMFYANIIGGSIVYYKDIWDKYAKYPEISLAEDAAFLQAVSKKARIARLPNNNVFIYVRHDTNSWRFNCGRFITIRGWKKINVPQFLPPEDLKFYQNINSLIFNKKRYYERSRT